MSTCSNCGRSVGSEFNFCPFCGTGSKEATGTDSLLGRTLNEKYAVLAELGEGSMGKVYLGEHVQLKKKVALKVLRPNMSMTEESLLRFQREGITAGQFSHPNAIQIFDFDRADGMFFLAMEFVEGRSLKQAIHEEGPLSPAAAVRLIRQVLSALVAAHTRGIIHRDLKPDNIMVAGDIYGDPLVKVLDFGLSKLVDSGREASLRTQTGMILGTPLYMSPEQCAGDEIDARSDLFSVGLILYELLAGDLPSREQTVSRILLERMSNPVPPILELRPDLNIPAGLDAVLRRAVAQKVEERYSSAEEMIADLDAVQIDGAAPAAAPLVRPVRPVASKAAESAPTLVMSGARLAPQRRSWALAAGAALVVAGLSFGAYKLWPDLDGASRAAARVRVKPESARTDGERSYLAMLDEARIALETNDLATATSRLDRAHQMASTLDAEAFLLRGQLFAKRQDLDTARLDCLEALRLDDRYAAAESELGWLALEMNDLEEARRRFERAAELDDESADALVGLGLLAEREGDDATAIQSYQQALSLDRSSSRAHYQLGLTQLRSGNVTEAIQSLVEARRHDIGSWRVNAALGEAYLAADRLVDARRVLDEANERRPGVPQVVAPLSSLLLLRDRPEDARDLLDRALDDHPDDASLRMLRGAALSDLGRLRDAAEDLEAAIAADPGLLRARELLGLVYLRQGRATELAGADTLSSDSIGGRFSYAVTLFEARRYQEAADALHALIDDAEVDMPAAHRALGVLYMDYIADPTGQAVRNLKRFLELNGPDETVSEWIRWIGRRG